MPSYRGEFLSPGPHHGTHHVRSDLPVLAEFLRLHQLLRNSLASLQKENGAEINIGLSRGTACPGCCGIFRAERGHLPSYAPWSAP